MTKVDKFTLFILMSSLITLMIMHPITAFQSLKQYRKKQEIKEHK